MFRHNSQSVNCSFNCAICVHCAGVIHAKHSTNYDVWLQNANDAMRTKPRSATFKAKANAMLPRPRPRPCHFEAKAKATKICPRTRTVLEDHIPGKHPENSILRTVFHSFFSQLISVDRFPQIAKTIFRFFKDYISICTYTTFIAHIKCLIHWNWRCDAKYRYRHPEYRHRVDPSLVTTPASAVVLFTSTTTLWVVFRYIVR